MVTATHVRNCLSISPEFSRPKLCIILSISVVTLAIIMLSTVYQEQVKFAFGQANPIAANNPTGPGNVPGNNATIQIMDWQYYNNSSRGFSIDYPAGWEKVVQGNNFIFLVPTDLSANTSLFRPGVGVIIEDLPMSGMTLEQYVNKTITDFPSRLGTNLVTIKETAILPNFRNGTDAHRLVYEWNDTRAGGSLRSMETYLLKNGKAYIISYVTPISTFFTYLPVAEKMTDSFKLKPIPQAQSQNVAGQNGSQLEQLTKSPNPITTTPPEQQFATYENSSLGTMQYPSNWEKLELGDGSVEFQSSKNMPSEQVEVLAFHPQIVLNSEDKMNELFQRLSYDYKREYSNYSLYEGPSHIYIDGRPALAVKFSYIDNNVPYKGMHILTMNQGDNTKAFDISANVRADLYPVFPPSHIQKMIDSLHLYPGPLSNATTTTSPAQPANLTTTTAPEEQFSTYEHPASGLKIQYPSNWHVDETFINQKGPEKFVSFYPSDQVSGTATISPNVDLQISKLDKGSSLSKELTDTIQSYDPKVVKVLEANTNSTLGGNPAFKLITKFTDNGKSYTSLETETIDGKKAYKITYDVKSEDYQKYLPIVESMINSFELPVGYSTKVCC